MARKIVKNIADSILERVASLYEGLALYKVSLNLCEEQAKNARHMGEATFKRLAATIERDAALESLPYGHLVEKDGVQRFKIISGHHRTRAAKIAGMPFIYVIVDERHLTQDQITSKQLAHNALAGADDEQLLKELYESIKDVSARIDAGLDDVQLDEQRFKLVRIEDISLEFDYKEVQVLFLPSQLKKLDTVIEALKKDAKVVVADMADFDRFTEVLEQAGKVEGITNISGLMSLMLDIVQEHLNVKEIEQGQQELQGRGRGRGGRKEQATRGGGLLDD